MKLASKLAFGLAATAALSLGAMDLWTRAAYKRSLQDMVTASAEGISDVVKRSTRHAMMKNSRDDLYDMIRSMGEQPGMRRLRIFNKEGQVTFSTDASEVGTNVDKSAEACYACHARSEPLQRLEGPGRVRQFNEPGNGRVLGVINPIENEADCSNAACHAHPAPQRVLGVLDVQMSLAGVDAAMAAFERRILILDILSVGLIAALAAALVFHMIHRRVAALMRGMRRVASGDLEHRLGVQGNDELSELAGAFNGMATDLAAARQEARQWAGTLEQRVAEKTGEVERAHKRLVEVEKIASLGKLSAAVAHEINNPLAGILTYAKLLSRTLDRQFDGDPRAADWKRTLEIIESESRRCGNIVKNLLTFARQVPLEKKENEINAIVERCLLLVRHQAELQGTEIEWSPAADLPPVVCDAAQVQQAVLAILINAVDIVQKGGHVRLATQRVDDEVHVSIADDGAGIPPDVAPHIFEPFFTTKPQGKGTGLGLSIAHGIVSQHSGRIDVASEAGRGTTFTIVLPLAPIAALTAT